MVKGINSWVRGPAERVSNKSRLEMILSARRARRYYYSAIVTHGVSSVAILNARTISRRPASRKGQARLACQRAADSTRLLREYRTHTQYSFSDNIRLATVLERHASHACIVIKYTAIEKLRQKRLSVINRKSRNSFSTKRQWGNFFVYPIMIINVQT